MKRIVLKIRKISVVSTYGFCAFKTVSAITGWPTTPEPWKTLKKPWNEIEP